MVERPEQVSVPAYQSGLRDAELSRLVSKFTLRRTGRRNLLCSITV
jgi:hypothetical protein